MKDKRKMKKSVWVISLLVVSFMVSGFSFWRVSVLQTDVKRHQNAIPILEEIISKLEPSIEYMIEFKAQLLAVDYEVN